MTGIATTNKPLKRKMKTLMKDVRKRAKLMIKERRVAEKKARAAEKEARAAEKIIEKKARAAEKEARAIERMAQKEARAAEKEARAAEKIIEKERKLIENGKKKCKRISIMALRAYKNFNSGYELRKTLRAKILKRAENGGKWDLVKAVKDMLSLPYYKNEAAASGAVHNTARHEDALAKVLENNGFLPYPLSSKLNRTETMKWMTQPELSTDIPDGTFIEQPFGTHNAPDFIVKVNDKFVLFLEAKSSSTALHPTYNSGGVKQNILYVFCARKTNETTIFKGDSVITLEQQRLIDEHIAEARKRDEELNRRLRDIDPNHRGISYYTRPMIIQSGGASYTNYFEHAQRDNAEKHALDWLKLKCTY